MSYIVPLPLPTSCNSCPYAHCIRQYPAWSKENGGLKILHCKAINTSRIIEIDYKDQTYKPLWCPLKELEET